MPDINTGFRNFHYRVIGWNSSIRPKPLPGAIKLNIKPQTQERQVLARTSNGLLLPVTMAKHEASRAATLEIVSLPVFFLKDVLGWAEDSSGTLVEGPFPMYHLELLYETNNVGNPMRHTLYDVVISRPAFDVSTLSENPNADKRSLELTINPDGSGKYQARCSQGDSEYDTWFN